MRDNNIFSLTKLIKARKLKEQSNAVVKRDETKWPVLDGIDIPSAVIATLQVVNIHDAGSLFLSKNWFGTLCALGLQCKCWDSTYVLENVHDYWINVNCSYNYSGFEIVKVGRDISVYRDGVLIYKDAGAANNIYVMVYIYGFIDGWRTGKKKRATKTVQDSIRMLLMNASFTESHVGGFYTELMKVLSDNNIGHQSSMEFSHCCELFKNSWVAILTAYELGDVHTLKNYSAQLIAMVVTVAEMPKYSFVNKSALADYLAMLVKHASGWEVNEYTDGVYLCGANETEVVPYGATLFSMRDWLIKATKVSVEKEKKNGEFFP